MTWRLAPLRHLGAQARFLFLEVLTEMSVQSTESKTGRISSSHSSLWGFGQRLTHSIASSIERTCQSQKPARSSFVSAKGPSMTVRRGPEKRTRLPSELALRPSPASITPAFTSCSLNAIISEISFSSGGTPASDSFVALTSTMTFMFRLLSPSRRAGNRRIDKSFFAVILRARRPEGSQTFPPAIESGILRPSASG